jgi:RNA polymerase sigma-70 factor (ECF subfamily)
VLSPALVTSLYARAGAGQWQVSEPAFADALARTLRHRFPSGLPDPATVEQYLSSLHLADLALAQACAAGNDAAWRHFLDEIRPGLRRAAHAIAGDEGGDLADGLYGDLFGIDERDGRRRSLFEYYHGRSSMLGWLRSVLSQRWVDRVRAARRAEPLPDGEEAPRAATTAVPSGGDPVEAADLARYLPVLREVVVDAFSALESRERLRLSLYYRQALTLAHAGRVLREHEATVSRQLDRTRRRLRDDVDARLKARGLDAAARARCYEIAVGDWGFDLEGVLPPAGVGAGGEPPAAPREEAVPAERKQRVRGRSESGGGAW